jgi:outer membrane protein OmpA-like peptidoglycan-associated protein
MITARALLLPATILLAITSYAIGQGKLPADEFVDSLRGLEGAVEVNAPALHQRALDRIKAAPNQPPLNRPPVAEELNKLPQLTAGIQFNPDSDVIRPESYKILGRIADALAHPYLLEYKFLVVDHMDATGRRENNLRLSQRRANAVREALTTTFHISARRVTALGLGEEQLRDAANPRAPANRRVQVIAIGNLEPVEPKQKQKAKGR